MDTFEVMPGSRYSIGALAVVLALVTVFLLGAASGYAVRAPGAESIRQQSSRQPAASTCPTATHVVVWYTARTWACVPDPTN